MELYAIGIYDFGLSEEAFWKMTFAQFHALSKQRNVNQKLIDYGFGTVAAMIGEPNRDKKSKAEPFSWFDFYPHWEDKKIKIKRRQGRSPDQLKSMFIGVIKPTINSRTKTSGGK